MADLAMTVALAKALGKPSDEQVTSAVDDWLDDHPEATTTVEDGSITPEKLESSFESKIAIHKKLNGWDTVNWKTGYINASGTVTTNGSFRNTDFIPVSAGDIISYKLSGYSNVVYIVTGYNSSKARVADASVVGSSSWAESTYTVPEGVAFVRLSTGNVTTARFSSDSVIGTAIISTKDYVDGENEALSGDIAGLDNRLDALDGVESIKRYYTESPNLADPTKTSSAGSVGAGYVYTDYIPVTAGERYTGYGNNTLYQLYWYDSNKDEVTHKTLNNRGFEYTAPSGSAYARLLYNSNAVTEVMFAHGVVGAYVPYGALIEMGELPDYIVRDTNNLIDPRKYVGATNVSTTTGEIYNYKNSRSTDFIPVDEGETYYLGGENDGYINLTGCAAYDSDYAFVETFSFPYTVPEGVAYIRIGYSTPADNLVSACIRKGQTMVSGLMKFDAYDTFRLANTKPSLYERANGLYGLKWNVMGDSITEGSGSTKSYMTFIKQRTGILPTNYGVSNTAIARRSESVTNDMCMRYSSMTDDADIITVFGGTNDHGNNIPIGEWGDATEYTLYGAMKILVEGLINKYMGKRIGFITPLPKYNTNNNTDYSYPSESFKPYIDCIKDVCARYSIPVLDLYTESGISPSMASVRTAMIPDGLHPNAVGHELISWQIQRFLERI